MVKSGKESSGNLRMNKTRVCVRVCVCENESLTKLRMWCGVLGMDFRGFHTVVLCHLHSHVCKALT